MQNQIIKVNFRRITEKKLYLGCTNLRDPEAPTPFVNTAMLSEISKSSVIMYVSSKDQYH